MSPLKGEFFRYFWAGCLAFGIDLLVLVGLAELAGLHYLIANLFSFAAGLTVSYLLCIRWVFEHRRLATAHHEFAIFTVLTLVGLGLNETIMWVGVECAGLHYVLAKGVAAGAVFAGNFLMKKEVLFR
jgi:putative flippase GtrA